MTCTPIPANTFAGTLTVRTCPSLDISSSSELRLTLPGWALMSASTDSASSSWSSPSPSTAASSPCSAPGRAVKTSASSRRGHSSACVSRAATSVTARSSAWCSAERMTVVTWAAVGGSIRSTRICRRSSARTCSSRRSSCQITSTRCETSLTRSVLVHSCQPVRSRSSLRCRFAGARGEVVEPQLGRGNAEFPRSAARPRRRRLPRRFPAPGLRGRSCPDEQTMSARDPVTAVAGCAVLRSGGRGRWDTCGHDGRRTDS